MTTGRRPSARSSPLGVPCGRITLSDAARLITIAGSAAAAPSCRVHLGTVEANCCSAMASSPGLTTRAEVLSFSASFGMLSTTQVSADCT